MPEEASQTCHMLPTRVLKYPRSNDPPVYCNSPCATPREAHMARSDQKLSQFILTIWAQMDTLQVLIGQKKLAQPATRNQHVY